MVVCEKITIFAKNFNRRSFFRKDPGGRKPEIRIAPEWHRSRPVPTIQIEYEDYT